MNKRFLVFSLLLLTLFLISGFFSTTSTSNVVSAESVALLDGTEEEMTLDSLDTAEASTESNTENSEGEEEEEAALEQNLEAETLSDEGEVLDTLDSLPTDESSNFENIDEDNMEDIGEDDEDINEDEAY
ncbi:predicted protein [Naegleria gruberi]|uniref:Predicted protein n=1 Tax=Naegleria gruberi TaxID=5762 RepID=D2W187_NAEGR|nr:uncharacterized protein NAEGRDRAFT_75130 [Naegleria gruberi]EFC37185.1 predicted protein [Naegleria gruberi]|eukprot:XP_002669929.1 predicted protein [Naegleria gruberi strain NEG-M]